MCTRMVPQHVWVHFCRKHYQRSRYRNPKEYAKLQCDFVQQQIRRIYDWSLENAKKGVKPTVQDWGLAIRKREQKRLDDLGGSRKRSAATFDEDSDEDENREDGPFQPPAVPATAVPQWLLALCGKGYSTKAILDIFKRLDNEIKEDILPCFPDIEILPNIVGDEDEPKVHQTQTKRTPRGHKRAQSLGVGMNYQSQSQDRRLSQPAITGHDNGAYPSSGQKRRRPNELNEVNSPTHMSSLQESRFSEQRYAEPLRRMPTQAAHRPTFPDVGEPQAEHYGFSSRSQYQVPLPAPVAQRRVGQSMAQHLENNDEYSHRRPSHQRSQSDIGGLHRGHYEYGSVPASGYAQDSHQPRTYYQESAQSNARSYASPQPRHEPQHQQYRNNRQSSQHPSFGHHRSQSSSMVHLPYTPAMPSLRENQPQASMSPRTRNIVESQEARNIFSSRR